MAVILDTSCLIVLSKINQINIIGKLFKDVVIPEAVADEFGEDLPDFIKIKKVKSKNLKKMASAFLDKGESEVIAFALESSADGIVIDEKKGRKVAKELNIKVIGTIGLILLAYKKEIIKDPGVILKKMSQAGFYIPEKILNEFSKFKQKF